MTRNNNNNFTEEVENRILSDTPKKSPPNTNKYTETLDDIELRSAITQFIVHNRLLFTASSKIIKSLSSNFHRDIIARCNMDANLITLITEKYISRRLKEEFPDELSESPFPLLIDTGSVLKF